MSYQTLLVKRNRKKNEEALAIATNINEMEVARLKFTT